MYDSQITLNRYLHYWNERGLGASDPLLIPRTTQLFAFVAAERFLSNWQVQAVSFWLLLSAGLSGCYILLRRFITENDEVASWSSLFYFLNLYSLSQIWGRYITAGIFAWAYLPWFLWSWMLWLDTGRKRYLVFFALSNVLFANTFGSPVFIFTFWIPAGIYSLFKLRPQIIQMVMRSLLGILCWLGIHFIWLYPFMTTSATSLSRSTEWFANFESLRGVSQYFGIDQLLLLRQGFLFSNYYFLHSFYDSLVATLASIGIVMVVVLGLIRGSNTFYKRFFVVLVIVGIIICKGTQPPLGIRIYQFAFKYFTPSMLLRNPYEKYGPAYLLAYTAVFAIGLTALNRKSKLLAMSAMCGVVFVSWPMWSGVMHQGRQVEVPKYYGEVNALLNQDKTDFRVLVMPLIPGEAVRYVWPRGTYEGAEPSEFLFDKNTLGRTDYNAANYKKFFELSELINNKQDLGVIFDQLGIKYILVHNDQDFAFSGASSSAQAIASLAKTPGIEYVNSIDKLSIYENTKFKSMVDITSDSPVEFKVVKKGTADYSIDIHNATSTVRLILKQAFNPKWTARIDGIIINDHFMVYGYANGWTINKQGNYRVNLSFDVWPTLSFGEE